MAGSALRGGVDVSAKPDADAARLSDLEQANLLLKIEVQEAKLEINNLRAQLRGDGGESGAPPERIGALPDADPDDPDPQAETERARLAKEALPGLEYHLSANPTDRDLLWEYVGTAARAGEYDTAISTLEGLLARNPDNPDILTQLGRAYLLKTQVVPNMMDQGMLAFAALERFDVAIEKHPEHYESRFYRARTNYSMPAFMNRSDAVVKDFEVLVNQARSSGDDERTADSFTWLVRAYQKAGRAEDAQGALRKGMELYPGNEGLGAMKQHLLQGE